MNLSYSVATKLITVIFSIYSTSQIYSNIAMQNIYTPLFLEDPSGVQDNFPLPLLLPQFVPKGKKGSSPPWPRWPQLQAEGDEAEKAL